MNLARNIAAVIFGPIGCIALLIAVLGMMASGAAYEFAGRLLTLAAACFIILFALGLRP